MINDPDAPSAGDPHIRSPWTTDDWLLAIGLAGLCLLGFIACLAILPPGYLVIGLCSLCLVGLIACFAKLPPGHID